MLLGFHGRYRIESIENLNHLVARVGDEIDYLKGKKAAFSLLHRSPIKLNTCIHRELPFYWILLFLIVFALLSFAGLRCMLSKQSTNSLSHI